MTRYLYQQDRNYPEYQSQMTAREIIEALFPGKGYGTKVPAHECANAEISGVQVMYMTSETAKAVWTAYHKDTRGMYMRAVAECPNCKKWFSASRLNQHGKACH